MEGKHLTINGALAQPLALGDRVNSFEFRQSFTGKRSSVAPQGAATNSARLGDDGSSFQKDVLPHLDDAYGLARWLIDDRTESENIVHAVCLSAFRGIREHSNFNARVWVLGIVHRAAYEWLGKNRTTALAAVEDSEVAEYARQGEIDAEAPESALFGTSATQLEAARRDEEFQRMTIAAALIVDDLSLTEGYANEGVARQMAVYQDAIASVPQRT